MNKPVTIIIADDHPMFRTGVRQALERETSFNILAEAGDGEKALQLINELQPEVAILDISMPKLSGLAVAKELKKQDKFPRIVLLTMFDDEEMLNEAMDLGVKAYLLKDSASVDIANAVRAVMDERHYISPTLTGNLLRRKTKQETFQTKHPAIDLLSPREKAILLLISESKTTKEIAKQLFLSPKTIENYRFRISDKLELKGSYSLLKFALENKTLL